MAVVLKINPGFDASYPWREIGTGASEPAVAAGLLPRPRRQGRRTAQAGGPGGAWPRSGSPRGR